MAVTDLLHEYKYGGQTFYQVSSPRIWDAVRERLDHDCLVHGKHYRLAERDGRRHTWLCCEVCGRKITKSRAPLSAWVEDGDERIERLQTEWRQRLDGERERLISQATQEASRRNARAKSAQRAEYAAYLRSPEWRHRRGQVLGRCGGMCEGCGERRAEEVHHLTYRHIGAEFLFELVALCADCHRRLHLDASYDDLEAVVL